jgi:hypothetical protein
MVNKNMAINVAKRNFLLIGENDRKYTALFLQEVKSLIISVNKFLSFRITDKLYPYLFFWWYNFIMSNDELLKKIRELEKRVKIIENFLTDQPSFEEAFEEANIDGSQDELYDKAVTIALQHDRVSASLLQRRMQIGFNRAMRLMEALSENGIIEPYVGSVPSKVLITREQLEELSKKLEDKEQKEKTKKSN